VHKREVLFSSITTRGGLGSDGSGFRKNRCPAVEIRFMDYPSVDRHGSVESVGRVGRVGWAGRSVGFN
jgi:hypothetical protein